MTELLNSVNNYILAIQTGDRNRFSDKASKPCCAERWWASTP